MSDRRSNDITIWLGIGTAAIIGAVLGSSFFEFRAQKTITEQRNELQRRQESEQRARVAAQRQAQEASQQMARMETELKRRQESEQRARMAFRRQEQQTAEQMVRMQDELQRREESEQRARMAAQRQTQETYQQVAKMMVFFNKECPICFEEFTEEGHPVLWCGHTFHMHCLKSSLEASPLTAFRCPLCRREPPPNLVNEYCRELELNCVACEQVRGPTIEVPMNGVIYPLSERNWNGMMNNLFMDENAQDVP